MGRALPLASALIAVGFAACGGDRAASRVDASASTKPRTLQDKRYLVWLRAPAEGWELLDEARAQELSPGAIAGWRHGDKCVGWVRVTERGEASRNAVGRAALAALDLPDKRVIMNEQALYCSITAWRWEAWGHDEADPSVQVAHRASFLDNADHIYEIHARARGSVHPNLRRCLDAITGAFDLLPGERVDLSRPAP